jgi:hypothetical protein
MISSLDKLYRLLQNYMALIISLGAGEVGVGGMNA